MYAYVNVCLGREKEVTGKRSHGVFSLWFSNGNIIVDCDLIH